MRLPVHKRRLHMLARASTLIAAASLIAACSTDAARFGDVLTTATSMTPNQRAIIKERGPVKQAFPGDVDTMTTHSTARTTAPAVRRSKLPAPPDAKVSRATIDERGENLGTLIAASQSERPRVAPPKLPDAGRTAREADKGTSGPIVLQPLNPQEAPLRLAGTDAMSTGSVKPRADSTPKRGWTRAGGTWVTLRDGETLYNLSRRYGVPVMAIMSANGIKDASSVAAGSQVIIPTYSFSASAPVSAPDSDPETNASRASRGFAGQASPSRVTVPKARGNQAPKVVALAPPAADSSASGPYVVKTGDTLYGIALRHGVTSENIMRANGMDDTRVRIGQKLIIPGRGAAQIATNGASAVDTTSTGSVPQETKPAKKSAASDITIASRSAEKTATPKKSGAGKFRWPAKGRIISSFGEKTRGRRNDGIDISVPVGTPVKASENGTVIYAGSELEDFGNLILVSHSGGWVTAYAHTSKTLVKRGDKVKRGQVIAKSGKSGTATVPKLHFEVRRDSKPVNPLSHLGNG